MCVCASVCVCVCVCALGVKRAVGILLMGPLMNTKNVNCRLKVVCMNVIIYVSA